MSMIREDFWHVISEIKDMVCILSFVFVVGGLVYWIFDYVKDIRTLEIEHITELTLQGTPPLEARCAIKSDN